MLRNISVDASTTQEAVNEVIDAFERLGATSAAVPSVDLERLRVTAVLNAWDFTSAVDFLVAFGWLILVDDRTRVVVTDRGRQRELRAR